MATLNLDLSNVDENDAGGSWRALPTGEYVAEIIESEYKQTRSGDGWILKLTFSVLEQEHKGKPIFDNLTLEHSNPKATEIGRAYLKQLALACGVPNPDLMKNSEDLHNLPVLVKIKRVVDDEFGDETGHKNRVVAYKPVSERKTARDTGSSGEPPLPTDADSPF